jgi:nitrogenase subunit NifH
VIIAANDLESMFAANRIVSRHNGKGETGHQLIDLFAQEIGANVLGMIPAEDTIRHSRIDGRTHFEIKSVNTYPTKNLPTLYSANLKAEG